jgi:hypothetical protein
MSLDYGSPNIDRQFDDTLSIPKSKRKKKSSTKPNTSLSTSTLSFSMPATDEYNKYIELCFQTELLKTLSKATVMKQTVQKKEVTMMTELQHDSKTERIQRVYFKSLESIISQYCSCKHYLEQFKYNSHNKKEEMSLLFQKFSTKVITQMKQTVLIIRRVVISFWQKIMSDYVSVYEQSKVVFKSDLELSIGYVL